MQKGSISNTFLIFSLIFFLVAGVVYFFTTTGDKPMVERTTDMSAYNAGVNELDTISSELDFETEEALDAELNQLETDITSL